MTRPPALEPTVSDPEMTTMMNIPKAEAQGKPRTDPRAMSSLANSPEDNMTVTRLQELENDHRRAVRR